MEVFCRKFAGILILLFIMISAAWAAESDTEAAGQVIVVSGSFQAQNANKETRTLARGAHFYTGDSLITGTNATAQIRFSDGTVMALNPNSQIKIDEYTYGKTFKSNKSTVSLVKGGLRELTGLIGKDNPEAVKLQTPVAVIGIRGTNFSALLDKNKLYSGVWKGKIFVSNDKGSINLGEGENYSFVLVDSKNSMPIGLLNPPTQLLPHQCDIYAPHTNF